MSGLKTPLPILNFPGEAMDVEHAIAEAAEKYRGEGYRVIPHPENGDVPTFVNGHHVDFVAFRGEEKVQVQVKDTMADLHGDQTDAGSLVELVKAQPGWRFDLVVVNLNAFPR